MQPARKPLGRPPGRALVAQRGDVVVHAAPVVHQTKNYTEDEIRDLITGAYTSVPADMWEFIPAGSHVRYVKRGAEPLGERFKPGGYVRYQHEKEGKKMMVLENRRGGRGDGYASWPVAFEGVEGVWKKHAPEVFVEMHMIHNSLAQKKRQIADLTATVAALTARLDAIERARR